MSQDLNERILKMKKFIRNETDEKLARIQEEGNSLQKTEMAKLVTHYTTLI